MEVPSSLIFLFVGSFLLFGVLTLTAFVKISIVFMVLRNALGLQQVPSNMVVMTLAFFLSMFISLPVISDSLATFATFDPDTTSLPDLIALIVQATTPFQEFLLRNTDPEYVSFFLELSREVWAGSGFQADENNIIVQIPAFLISEMTHAFEMGFLLYLPFIAIDLTVTVILMAMGMQQVQPSIIATPFKLLLFVSLDGWSKMVEGLVLTYGTVA